MSAFRFDNVEVTAVSGPVLGNEEFFVTLDYPRNEESKFKAVQIHLCDVRAADGIRVSYDFDRDGWKIEQQQVFEWDVSDPVCDQQWIEVAFVQAWGSEIEKDQLA